MYFGVGDNILNISYECLQVDNAVPYQDLPIIDQHALFQLENVVKNIKECYENYQFFKIFQVLNLTILF